MGDKCVRGRAAGLVPAVRTAVRTAGASPAARFVKIVRDKAMQPDDAFALLITWTCYGTWLPGDERGHVSNVCLPDGGYEPKQNIPGTPVAAGHVLTRELARALQKGETVWLTPTEALCTATALASAAQERGWRILRASIMANHVHVVVCDCPDDGPAVRRVLKGVSQAALSRARGHARRWWTQGGSDRYKHGTAAVEAAVNYVANQEHKLAEIVDMEVRAVSS
jgi:REP element-mobilizing transposase RayT